MSEKLKLISDEQYRQLVTEAFLAEGVDPDIVKLLEVEISPMDGFGIKLRIFLIDRVPIRLPTYVPMYYRNIDTAKKRIASCISSTLQTKDINEMFLKKIMGH